MINSDVIYKKIFSKKAIERINNKMNLLGYQNTYNINVYLNLKLLILIVAFIYVFFMVSYGYILCIISTFVLYYLYDYLLLDIKLKKRENILEHDAIFFFEVLALTLQSEKNLKLCLEITSNAIDSELSKEIKYALSEIKVGKSLTEALDDVKKRIPSKSVNNVILNLIESNIYGTNIVSALEGQTQYLTDKRILDVKAKINKMPTKISIVSVLLFIPLIMILILGPVIINYFFS